MKQVELNIFSSITVEYLNNMKNIKLKWIHFLHVLVNTKHFGLEGARNIQFLDCNYIFI